MTLLSPPTTNFDTTKIRNFQVTETYLHVTDIKFLGRVATTEISSDVKIIIFDDSCYYISCWYALCSLCCKKPENFTKPGIYTRYLKHLHNLPWLSTLILNILMDHIAHPCYDIFPNSVQYRVLCSFSGIQNQTPFFRSKIRSPVFE